MKIGKDWVDRGADGPTVTAGDDHLGHGGHDANGRLLPHGLERLVDWWDAEVLDDLRLLHALAGSDVEFGHVTLDIRIADNREHLGESDAQNLSKMNDNGVLEISADQRDVHWQGLKVGQLQTTNY